MSKVNKSKFTVGVFGMIFDESDRILFVHRRDYDLWNLPGGGMKLGESVEGCLTREVKEETGLDVKPVFLSSIYTKKDKTNLVFSFVCEVVGGKLTKTDEADKLEYFDIDNLPEPIVGKQVERLKRYLEDKNKLHIDMHKSCKSNMDILKEKSKSSTRKPLENYAFIDGQNLHKGVEKLSWELDYYRLRHYLRAKFGVRDAYIFLGYVEKYENLYKHLKRCGFKLIFKQVVHDKNNGPKGNVDVDITLYVMKHLKEFAKAVLITSDGDFVPLIRELKGHGKFSVLISPSKNKCSHLLKQEVGILHVPLTKIKTKIEKQMKKHTADR